MFRRSAAFMVCSNIIKVTKAAHKTVPQSIILWLPTYDVLWHYYRRDAWEIVIHPTKQLASTSSCSSSDVLGPTVGVIDNDLGQQRHTSGTSASQSHIHQCLLKSVFRKSFTCTILGCQLNHCLAPILVCQAGQSPMFFSFDGWRKSSIFRLLLVSPPFIHFAQILITVYIEQPTSHAVSEILICSLRAITIRLLSNPLTWSNFFHHSQK